MLIPYARNARTHSEAQIAQIAASIREFGWTNPVLVDGDNGVIAGHGRLLAARKLGMSSVPVIELAGLSDAARRAYILADNRLALNAGWDEAMLGAEAADLLNFGIDLEIAGFGASELERLVAAAGYQAGFPDEAPAPPERATTVRGDVWLLGRHRLLCGDATDPSDLELVLNGGLADMVFTDPPYNVSYEGKTSKRLTIDNDALGAEFGEFLENACRALLGVSKGAAYICMGCSEIDVLKSAFERAGGHWSTFLIWTKNVFTLGRSDYQRQYEPILYGWAKGSRHYWCGARDQGDVWEIARPVKNDIHPTMKPVALVERAIRNSSKSRDTVLDPFAGSGTTLMAAEATGRTAALVEIDPRYCDVIVRRWQEATGELAKREADGLGFDEASQEAGHPA
jgi:DNA modification methylase